MSNWVQSNSDSAGDTTDSQEELPNHLKNCSIFTQLSPIDCPLKNKYCVLILSWRCLLKLKNISYLTNLCHHINCLCSDAGVNWDPLDLRTKQKIVFFLYHLTLQLHVPWAFPKFNKDEKLRINTTLPFLSLDYILPKSISLGWLHPPALGWNLSGKTFVINCPKRNPAIFFCSKQNKMTKTTSVITG